MTHALATGTDALTVALPHPRPASADNGCSDIPAGQGPTGRVNRQADAATRWTLTALLGLDADGPEPWQDQALCAQTDPEAFFPEKGGSTREAKRICTGCDVRAECLTAALANDERFGIWGGLSERERRRLRRRPS